MVIKEDLEWFMLKPEDITKSFIYANFAPTTKSAPHKFNDHIKVPSNLPSESLFLKFSNHKDIKETTKGKIIANYFMGIIALRKNVEKTYVNEPFTKGVFGDNFDDYYAKVYMDNKLDSKDMAEYIDRTQWLGYIVSTFSIPSLDYDTLVMSDDVEKYKKNALEKGKDIIAKNDPVGFDKIEKDVLKYAVDDCVKRGATGIITYKSGWNGEIGNHFKNTSIFRGVAPKSYDKTQFVINTSNLVDGVNKKDIVSHADIGVAGGLGRAIDTQKGGYDTKKNNAAFAHMKSDVKGSDCKTKLTRTIEVTPAVLKRYRNRYIMVNGKPVLLTKEYLGKTVQLRSPLYCQGKNYCNICLGESFYRLGIKNIGLKVARQSAVIMNLSMKAFHHMAVTPSVLDVFKYIEVDKDPDSLKPLED